MINSAKSGVEPKNALGLIQHLVKECPRLMYGIDDCSFKGLMTIGQEGDLAAFR